MPVPELTLEFNNQQQTSSIPVIINKDTGFYSLPMDLIGSTQIPERGNGAVGQAGPAGAQQMIGMLIYDRQAGCLVLYPTAPQPLDEEKTAQDLSRREQEVLQLLPSGLSNRQIGRILSISESTVKSHVGSIFAKLNLSSRAEAAVYALRNGLATAA
jgi:DNA-binding CsgD family transcriptional regulator